MACFMFDTNVFNHFLDGPGNYQEISVWPRVLVTHIQHDELCATRNADRRQALLSVFEEIPSDEASTDSAVWDVSKFDKSGWTQPGSIMKAIRARLDELNRGKANNTQDALIAEAAINRSCVLVTDDDDLLKTTREFAGKAISLDDFLSRHLAELGGKRNEATKTP